MLPRANVYQLGILGPGAADSWDTVYGPPHECKGTLRTTGAVCVYVFGLQMEMILLATMSSARACSN
jgi:hypothetical protein